MTKLPARKHETFRPISHCKNNDENKLVVGQALEQGEVVIEKCA